jgi:hypothetical protein
MSLRGYRVKRQYERQNIRAISKLRRELEIIRVPADPKIRNGRQRPLNQEEIDFIVVNRTSGKYSHREHSDAAEPLYAAGDTGQAQSMMTERWRKGVNLNQERWPDAEILNRPYLMRDLEGNEFYVFRVTYAKGKAAAEAAKRFEAPLNGLKEKIRRFEDFAVNERRVTTSLQRYEREILGGFGQNQNQNRRKRRGNQ